MIVSVKEYEKSYEFTLTSVAQLCGQNILLKTYIFESLRRYFSNYKYSEDGNPWRDNITINGEVWGRKSFEILSISNRNDLISMINMSKQSLLTKYLKNSLHNFEHQTALKIIDDELLKIISKINDELEDVGNIQLDYAVSSIWDMVQKTKVIGRENQELDSLKNSDLLDILLGLLDQISEEGNFKKLVLFENIDHMISPREYRRLYEKMIDIYMRKNILFLCSISLDGYPIISDSSLQEICVVNDDLFQFPSLEILSKCIVDNYPVFIKEITPEMLEALEMVIHKIAKEEYLVTQEMNVLLKLINSSIAFPQYLNQKENLILQTYLRNL